MLRYLNIVFLALILSYSKSNAQACLMRFDKKIVCWEKFTYKDTSNGKINLFLNENYTKTISVKSFIGIVLKDGKFLLLHDSTYLVKNASTEFYKSHLKTITLNPKGNHFYYDNLNLNRKYIHKIALHLNDKIIKKDVGKYKLLVGLKGLFIATFIGGIPGIPWMLISKPLEEPIWMQAGIIATAVSAVSVGSIILINKKQRKLNREIIDRYNSLLVAQ